MSSSLDYLASLLPSDKKIILHTECAKFGYSAEQMGMLEKKGVMCYDYIDCMDRLDETELPCKEDFYSKLTESAVGDDEYATAQAVWNAFDEIKCIGDYTELYLKTDVLLLADVFENFRKNCHNIYGLDPAHYFTAPGFSFDAMLRHTKVELQLLTDVDMLLFVEKGIRGGISQCSKRYAKANNKHVDGYQAEMDTTYLLYLDANNLYGYSMMQELPINGFEWVENVGQIDERAILAIPQDSPTGYMFEVDLEYPDELHDKHKDYPMCAETCRVPGTKAERKLLLTMYPKKKYVIHYRMLQCALQQGLKLKKIYRCLKFNQTKWLEPYIKLNTEMRTKAVNEFEKNLYKLMSNAIYGKTIENVRSRSEIFIRGTYDGRYGAKKLISLPNFKRISVFGEDLVAVHMNTTRIVMNKPIAVGMCVLELSKELMYDFHYNRMKQLYGDNIELLYTGNNNTLFYSLL